MYWGYRAKIPLKKQRGARHHEFIMIKDSKGNTTTFGLVSNSILGFGWISVNADWDINYKQHDGFILEVPNKDADQMLEQLWKEASKQHFYLILPGSDSCQDWARRQIGEHYP